MIFFLKADFNLGQPKINLDITFNVPIEVD